MVTEAELYERLKNEKVCLVLEDALMQIHRLPPDGAAIHHRERTIIMSLDSSQTFMQENKKEGLTFQEYRQVDEMRFGRIISALSESINQYSICI